MIGNEDEIVRVKILRCGHRSSVSMDIYLAGLLKSMLGGDVEFRAWVQSTVNELDRLWQERASDEKTGTRIKSKSGLSRMVQREAIRQITSRSISTWN
jgi:hypothetical protein